MEENLEKKEVDPKDDLVKDSEGKVENNNINNNLKSKRMNIRTMIVLAVIAIAIIGMCISYRASYLKTLEIGEEYTEAFSQSVKYKLYIGGINFAFVFSAVFITNKLIKKGLKQFFDEDKKEMPKLPNKSLALIIALITSIIVSNMFLQKTICKFSMVWNIRTCI